MIHFKLKAADDDSIDIDISGQGLEVTALLVGAADSDERIKLILESAVDVLNSKEFAEFKKEHKTLPNFNMANIKTAGDA